MTTGSEIKRVGSQGKRFRTRHLEVRILASPLLHPRFGFIVPKYGRSSVERNRVKRRLREIVRTRLLPHTSPIDVVVKGRPNVYTASFGVLSDELYGVVDTAAGQLLK